MTIVRDILERAYTKVNGEYEVLNESSDDFKTYLNVMNQVMGIWATTPYVKWQSLYDMNFVLPDQASVSQLTYPVPNASAINLANTPYDSIYFVDQDGTIVDKYKMTNQAVFDSSNSDKIACFTGGSIHFKTLSADLVGTSIRLPVYVLPKEYKTPFEEVEVDSVTWLITAMAAFISNTSPVPFIARNADRYEKEAEKYMKAMKDNNRHAQHLVIKSMADMSTHTWSDVLDSMSLKDL